jgi:hypothetical protein
MIIDLKNENAYFAETMYYIYKSTPETKCSKRNKIKYVLDIIKKFELTSDDTDTDKDKYCLVIISQPYINPESSNYFQNSRFHTDEFSTLQLKNQEITKLFPDLQPEYVTVQPIDKTSNINLSVSTVVKYHSTEFRSVGISNDNKKPITCFNNKTTTHSTPYYMNESQCRTVGNNALSEKCDEKRLVNRVHFSFFNELNNLNRFTDFTLINFSDIISDVQSCTKVSYQAYISNPSKFNFQAGGKTQKRRVK